MNVSVVTKDKPLKAARNDSLYNAMAAKVCQGHFIPFILAPEEDDSQCRFALQGQPPEMIVTGDTDLSSIAGKVFNLSKASLVSAIQVHGGMHF